MPGTILLEDAQKFYTDRLQQHAQDALQAVQQANEPPLRNAVAPALPNPQVDPNEIVQRLQQFGQDAFQAAQQANQPPLQGVQIDPNAITERLQQHAQDAFQAVDQTVQPIAQGLQQANQPPFAQGVQEAQPPAPTTDTTSPTPSAPPLERGGDLRAYARQAAQRAGIDPDIFVRQIEQESGFDPAAKSPAGAQGIAQFMPGTAAGLKLDPSDPYASLDAAAQLDAQNLAKYGGDYAKALAAYNAGGGNVDKYGGVPPFAETQDYVKTILGGAKQAVGNVVQGAQQAVSNVLPALSQFGDKQLTAAEAYAACGPAAAVRFAQMFGRNPTLREATDLAQSVGWTAEQGMAGLRSESQLFTEMGIPHRVVGADWQALAREAQSGNPVTISTPGHYFTADSYDPRSGAFHVGSSGTDLRGGSEWMTPEQMEQRMGALQGGLAADNPGTPAPSPVSGPVQQAQQLVQQGGRAIQGGLQQVDRAVQGVVSGAAGAVQGAGNNLAGNLGLRPRTPEEQAQADRIQQAMDQSRFRTPDVTDLIPGAGTLPPVGVGTSTPGDVLEQQINQAVAEGNPARDIPVAGPVSTLIGQQVLNPTNWALTAGPGLRPGRAAIELAQEPSVARFLAEEAGTLNIGRPAPGGEGPQPASTRLSVAELADALRQYPQDVQNGLRGFIETQTQAGRSGAEINDTLRQWVAEHPLPAAAETTAPGAVAPTQPQAEANTVRQLSTWLVKPEGRPGISVEPMANGVGTPRPESGWNIVYRDADGQPQGILAILKKPDQTLDVAEVAVNPEFQRQGVATSLYQAAKDAGIDIESVTGRGGYTPEGAALAQSRIDRGLVSAAEPGTLPPLEALTSGTSPLPPPPPTVGPPPTTGPTRGPGVLGAPGEAASRFGALVASALSPTENLPVATRGVITNYANMVGRQSAAARVLAENEMRTAGARLDIPAVAEQVQQRMGELRDEAAHTLVQNLQQQGKAAPVGSAPREFRTVTDDPNAYLANYAFSPDVVGPIKAVTDMSQIAGNPLGSAVLKTIGTAKGTLFSLSNFHTLTEGLNAAFTSPQTLGNYLRALGSDSFAQGLRGSMADTFDAAAKAGVTGLAEHVRPEDVGTQLAGAVTRRLVAGGVSGVGGAAAGYTETKLTGGTEEEARANAAKGGIAGLALAGVPLPGGRGTLPEILQSALWDRAVPVAKATAWDALQKGGLDPQAAAQVVNERFGGLNYAAMGRNATLLDAQRLSLMASDWNEATVRQLGSAIFGGDGSGVTRGFLARTIASMMGVTEAANVALSGHSTLQNQPGHQFEVEMPNPGGGYLHFGILPGNLQAYLNLANTMIGDPAKRATAPTNFIVNRLSAPASAGIDMALAAAGKPPFQIARAGPIALGENVAPIGVSQVLQSTLRGGMNPVVAAGLAAAGLNPRYSNSRGAFVAPETGRMAPPSRAASSAGSSGERAPVPKR
jgi:soluble lytic murein transglycosylase-like protein/ribosomal protein S18 acetylase RimI-like enzyme